jgi:hypothetical protein
MKVVKYTDIPTGAFFVALDFRTAYKHPVLYKKTGPRFAQVNGGSGQWKQFIWNKSCVRVNSLDELPLAVQYARDNITTR